MLNISLRMLVLLALDARTWRGFAVVVGVPGDRVSLGQLSSTHSQAAFLSPSLQGTREALAQGSHS